MRVHRNITRTLELSAEELYEAIAAAHDLPISNIRSVQVEATGSVKDKVTVIVTEHSSEDR